MLMWPLLSRAAVTICVADGCEAQRHDNLVSAARRRSGELVALYCGAAAAAALPAWAARHGLQPARVEQILRVESFSIEPCVLCKPPGTLHLTTLNCFKAFR